MKKTAKRAKVKPSSRRAGAKSSPARSKKPSMSAKPNKKSSSKAPSKLKRVARKAASAAIVAGGMAAIGTALQELNPGKRKPEGAASDEPSRTDEGKRKG
jgi:hypothetical protein